MATTPTYSWPIPDDTDLVKDGAEAIRDLGNAIDTTVDGLGVGLVHIKTVTDTSVSAINVDDCFSADFLDYLILIYSEPPSTTSFNNLRFRTASASNSTSNYSWVTQRISSAGSGFNTQGQARSTNLIQLFQGAPDPNFQKITISRPFASKITYLTNEYTVPLANLEKGAGAFNATTSFDGFQIFPNTGTITATIEVFGFKV
jgi:hypothetical protein